MIPNKVHFEFQSQIKDKEGRFIMVKGKLDDKDMTLLNVYAPPGSNKTINKRIFDVIAFQSTGVLICAGDLNVILNPRLDTTNQKRKITPTEKLIKRRIQDLGLIDIRRDFHRQDRQFNFYSNRHNAYSGIDYLLMHNSERHRLKEYEINQRDISDHCSVYLKSHLDTRPKVTTWRFNVSMLNSPEFKGKIKNELKIYLEDNDDGNVNPESESNIRICIHKKNEN